MVSPTYRHLPAELGLEPPITMDGAVVETLVRQRVNGRWLFGLVLTGLAGTAMMLFAAAGALGTLSDAVKAPEMLKSAEERAVAGAGVIAARKGDKLIRKANLVAARQDYKAPIQVRVGQAEITKQASFTRLATPLTTESLGFADSVPAFNLARLVSMASEDRAAVDGELGTTQDTEIGLSFRDILLARNVTSSEITMRDEDSLAQVTELLAERRRDAPRTSAQSQLARVMRAPTSESSISAFAPSSVADPFSKLTVRMVPENVTIIPRQEGLLTSFAAEERLILSRSTQHASQSLRQVGATPKQVNEIIAALTRNGRTATLDGNRILKLTLQAAEPGAPRELMRVEVFFDEQLVSSTGRRDDGTFWPIEVRELSSPGTAARKETDAAEEDEDAEANSGRLTLYASIHETARRHDIPAPLIDEIIRTIFFDVDLQRRVQPGDQIELLIANGEGDTANRSDLMLVSLSTQGQKRRYYRFKLQDEDIVEYFDDQGRSVKQFLLRKPMDGGEFRSGFGMRRHPITRSYRLHAGVDWAGPVGLPIRAAGNGLVRAAGWDSGYGRRVEIEHNHGYVTTYSHMSSFAPGIKDGVRVRQGQIIGRLGSSGLSTGPHLHYEVLINDRFVDPLAIRLPRGRELSGNQLAEFRKERDFVEAMLKRAPGAASLVAQGN
jgi:murein DD-endopeptidase MepM/ murein hydrolase activator NlpD